MEDRAINYEVENTEVKETEVTTEQETSKGGGVVLGVIVGLVITGGVIAYKALKGKFGSKNKEEDQQEGDSNVIEGTFTEVNSESNEAAE